MYAPKPKASFREGTCGKRLLAPHACAPDSLPAATCPPYTQERLRKPDWLKVSPGGLQLPVLPLYILLPCGSTCPSHSSKPKIARGPAWWSEVHGHQGQATRAGPIYRV